MYSKSLVFAILFTFLTLVCFVVEAKIVEKILVIVNDDVITKTELEERLAKLKEQRREELRRLGRYDEAKLSQEMEKARPEILESMIDELLFIQEAVKKNIHISDVEVQQDIENIKKEYGSDSAFERALAAEGYTLDIFKKERKRVLLFQRLVEENFAEALRVTDDEVRQYYRENRDKFPSRSDSVKLKHILIKYNTTEADKEKARHRAENLRRQCIEGADFGEMAEKFSDDLNTKVLRGDMGYFFPGTGQYYPQLEDTASKLSVGEISELIEGPYGYDIIKVIDIDKESGAVRALRINIAIWPDPESERSAEEKANSIIEQLNKGADFVEMVKRYSDDTLTKDKGGDWMAVPIDKMGPDLRSAFDSFDEGRISRPVKAPYGIHIFKIVERQELTKDEIEQLREFLRATRLEEKLREYSKKLREEAYIQKLAEN